MSKHIYCNPLPSIEKLNDYFDVCIYSGIITWKKSRCGIKIGKKAGSKNNQGGYIRIKIDGKLYLAHRIIWFYFSGIDPIDYEIDHIDGNKENNKISNLRIATKSQNKINSGTYSNNKSGYRGVYWHKQHRKFVASINVDGKNMHLGLFKNKEDAASAYREASKKHFGSFSRV